MAALIRKKTFPKYGFLAGGIAIVALLLWLLWPKPTLESELARMAQCYARKDAGCIAGFATRKELVDHGLTRTQFQQLVSEVLNGYSSIAGAIEEKSAQTGEIHAQIATGDSRPLRSHIAAHVAYTEEGIKSPQIVRSTILGTQIEYREQLTNAPARAALFIASARWAREKGSDLQRRYGIQHIYVGRDPRKMTWEEAAAYYDETARQLAEAAP